MKKKFLNRMNIMLGAVSLTLAGCHSSKQAATDSTSRPMLKYGVPAEVIDMYGVPMPEECVIPEVPPTQEDTTAAPEPTIEPKPGDHEIIVTKYGIPPSFLDR